jgi:dimethylglycine dehydrogenase
MVHGAADISMRDYDPRRFGPYATKEWQVIKAKEDYCLRHEIPFPHFNRLAGRPVKPSPLYERLKAKGAVFEEVYGHERPRWFARHGVEQRDHYGFRRTPVHEMVAFECNAVRSAPGIMDISAFTKVEVSGPGAEALLDRLVANKLPQNPAASRSPTCSTAAAGSNLKPRWCGWRETVSIWSARRFSSSA